MFILLPLLSSCSGGGPDEESIEIITERFFAQQVGNVLQNLDTYTGRTFQIEGMFWGWGDGTPGADTYYFVIRHLSACCEGGGTIGFELYMGDFEPFEDNAWVHVTGVLEIRHGWQPNNPVLVVTAIEELPFRGAETVSS